jgi:hypothetical protein
MSESSVKTIAERSALTMAHRRSDRAGRWRQLIAAQDFDPATQLIGAAEAAAAPHAAARLRLAVLLATYDGDYHTDAYAFDAIAERMSTGAERIVLWGDRQAIADARRQLSGSAAAGPTPPLGTATVIDAAAELGPGYGEMCRTGSVSATVGAVAPILTEVLELIGDGRWHTLASVPRNRASAPGIRGGAAIHRLHARAIGSSFRGLAPWYVMQGGALEVLDFREIPMDDAVPDAGPAVLADPDDAAYVDALLGGAAGEIGETAAGAPARWAQRSVAEGERAWANPRFVRPEPDGAHASLEAALAAAETAPHSCVVVQLWLDEDTAAQRELAGRGYVLGAVSPATGRVSGLWSRPHAGLPLAPPHYLSRPARTPRAQALLELLQQRYRAWEARA